MFAISSGLLGDAAASPVTASSVASTVPRGSGPDRLVHQILDAGADGVLIKRRLSVEALAGLLEVARGVGCPVLAIEAPNPRPAEANRREEAFDRLTPSSQDPQARAMVVRSCRTALEYASESAGKLVVMGLGRIEFDPSQRQDLAGRQSEARPWFDAARRSVGELLPAAEKHAVRLALEMPGELFDLPSFRELEVLLAEFEGAPLGVWFDPENARFLETEKLKAASAWIERFSPKILGGSLRDLLDEDGEITRDVLPGEGSIDFAALKNQLPQGTFCWDTRGEHDSGKVRESISHLRRAGWL